VLESTSVTTVDVSAAEAAGPFHTHSGRPALDRTFRFPAVEQTQSTTFVGRQLLSGRSSQSEDPCGSLAPAGEVHNHQDKPARHPLTTRVIF
jgi:hypothetical protein